MLAIRKAKVVGATEYFLLGIIDNDGDNITSVSIIGGEPKECSVQRSKMKKDRFEQEYFIRNGSRYYISEFSN